MNPNMVSLPAPYNSEEYTSLYTTGAVPTRPQPQPYWVDLPYLREMPIKRAISAALECRQLSPKQIQPIDWCVEHKKTGREVALVRTSLGLFLIQRMTGLLINALETVFRMSEQSVRSFSSGMRGMSQ